MPAVDEDRFLYWPVLIAFGCPILCVLIWSGALFSAPWPSVRIVLQFISGACEASTARACSLGFGLAVALVIPAVLVWLSAPLIFLSWIVVGFVAPAIAVAMYMERGLRRSWRRLLSILTLLPVSLAAAFNIGFVWRTEHIAADDIRFLAAYPRYKKEISQLPSDKPRFKVWDWTGDAPCSVGVAYDETDAAGSSAGTWAEPFERWHIRSHVSGVPVYAESTAFRHFYFVSICAD